MTDAEELNKIATEAKTLTSAKIRYKEMLASARKLAEHGETQMVTRLFKPAYYEEMIGADQIQVPSLKTAEEYARELAGDQDELIKLFEQNGFTVTSKEPEVPSVISLTNPREIAIAEHESAMIRKFADRDVTISWTDAPKV